MSGTYMRDYAQLDPESIDARATPLEPDDEPLPRGWRLNLLTAGTVVGVLLMIVGGVCLGLLFGARPESEGLTDAQMWTQNTDLMAKSAFAVIALFLGAEMLLFAAAGHFVGRLYRARAAASATAQCERREIIGAQHGIMAAVEDLRSRAAGIARMIEALSARVASLEEIREVVGQLQCQQETLAEMVVAADGRMMITLPNSDVYELGKQVGREEAEQRIRDDPNS